MNRLKLIHLFAAAALAFGPGAAFGQAVSLSCGTLPVTVTATDGADARRVCAVAAKAEQRLGTLGLAIDKAILIEVTEDLDVAPGTCVALYSTAERKLQILPSDCLDDQPGRAKTFPAMEAEVLFDSLIVHEMVHAYVDQAVTQRNLSRIAHEYLAYAIQLDMLPPGERERVLAKASVAGPVAADAFNEAILNLSPLTFAAMAWLHFNAAGGDSALVGRVLDGSLAFYSLRE